MRNGSICMAAFYAGRQSRNNPGRWPSEERQLVTPTRRAAEGACAEGREASVEPVLSRRHVEERRDLRGVLSVPALAVEEARIAETAAPHLPDAVEHPLPPVRIVLREPAVEQLVERLREAEHHPARAPGAGARGRLE